MTEQTDTPTVNTLGFSEWSSANVYDNPLESRLKFGDYLREEYIKADAYTAEIEEGFRKGFVDVLRRDKILNDDGSNFEEVQKQISELEGAPSDDSKDDSFRAQVDSGELPMARLSTGELYVGDAAADMNLVSALKISSDAGVRMQDALAAQAQLAIPDGFKEPLYKVKRIAAAQRFLEEERKQNTEFDIELDGLSTEAAQSEYSTMDWVEHKFNSIGRFGVNILSRVMGRGDAVDEAEKRRKAVDEARGIDMDQLAAKYAVKYDVRPEDMQLALEQMVLENATNKQMFEFHDADDADVGKNLRMGGYGLPTMSMQAMINKDVFDKTLAANPDLSDDVKTMLNKQRISVLKTQFVDLDKFLSKSAVSDEWNKSLVVGRSAGVDDYKILEGFVADKDNYNEFAQRAAGIGMSFINGFGQLVAALPAALGADPAKDYLASVSQANSDRRQLASVFGQEFGFFQDLGETAFPMLIDVGATALLAAGTAPAGGAGGIAYAALKAGGKSSASLTGKGIIKAITSNTLRTSSAKSVADQAEDLIAANFIKGSKEGAIDILKAYNSKLSAQLGNLPAVFIPAGTRSGAATYGAVYNQLKQNPNVTPEEAHDRALGSGLMAMTFTGSLVSGFSLIGKGGFEDALLRGLTTKQMNTVAKSVTNMVEGDLLDAAGKAIKSAMKKHAFGTAKGIGKNVVDEGIEEGIDEFVNTLITDAALDENTPMLERMQQTFHAVALGGVMGGSVPLVRRGLSRLQPDVLKQREQSMFLDQILEDASRDLTESGSPITADVFRAIISERGRRDQRRSEVPTPEEAVQLLTGDTQETDSESEKLASGITSNPEFEARLTERVNPTTTAKAISEVLAEDTPVVSGLDPSTIEAKGDMMRQLELPLAESSSNENSDHAIIRGLIAGQKESPKFNRNQFVDSATVKTQRVIDPSKKEDAEAIEAGFRQIIQEIDAAEALYKKLDRQAQAGDLSSESPAMRALQKNVNEGTAVSPEEAVDLRGDAFKKRVVELEGLKIDEEISFEELQADPEEESAVQSVIDKGFSEVIAASKLKRLGIPVNERTISDEFIAATNKKISDGISEKFPDVKVSEPQGGLTLSSTYGSGKVYLDRFGNGQFDNNPANMLGLFEQGTPIVVPESVVRSATVNPAFRFSQIGDNFFVADILIAQNGGVVSALTPFDRVATLQPDYTRTVELLERVVAFRAEGLTDPDEFIPSPFAPDARITKKDLLARLDSGLGMEQFVAPSSGELSPDFQRSALIELRLRAQDALFTNQNVSLVSLGREISDLYLQEQKDRIKYSNAAFVSTVSVTSASALQQNEEFNPSAEAEDSYTAFPESTRAFSETGIASILKEAEANAIAAIDADRPLKQTIVNLVNTEVFSSSKKDIGNTSTRKLLGLTMQWMAQGNNRANPASVEFQQALKTGNYRLGGPVREALQLMALSSASVEGSPKTNESYRATLKSKLSKIAGDRDITDSEVIAFHSQVKRSVGKLLLRSQPSGMSRAHDREVNTQAIEELGLKSNDSDSLVEAVKRIAGVSKEGGVDYDANIKAVAKLLLQSPDFLATVDLTIDDTSLEYAGDFEMLIDGTPSISINISGYNPRGVGNTLIHELIHAYVTQVTRKPQSQQSRKEAAAINNLTNLIVKLKEDFKSTSSKALEPDFIRMLDPFNPVKFDRKVYKFHDTRVYDGLANVDEFIAHFLTSTDFQKFVKSMTASSKADGNIFQKIISYIRSLIKGSNPTFDSAFSAVLDLSKSSIAETQKKFIASPRAPREPLSTKAIMGQIAESVAQEQGDSVRLASGLGAATGVTETTAIEGFENVERTIEYLRNQIVPPEVEVVVDTNSISMMSVSNDTGVMTINPIKIAAYLASLNAQNGGDPMPLRTQLNVMAVISNEEIAHAAAVKTNTTQEQDAIIESMTFADAEQAMSNYGDEGNATTREELLAGWEQGNRSSQVTIMEEYLRQHAQKVVRGFTTEEEVIFLSQNPSILQYVIRYFKRFLKRLGYYREAKNITPQLRQAVGRVVNEIRAMESGFRYQPTMMAFDANSPDALIEQFRKQVNMNKPVERPDTPQQVQKEQTEEEQTEEEQTEEQAPEDVTLETGITGQAGSFGTASNLPSEFNSEGVDYSDFVSVLELPYIEAGPFKVVRSKFKKLFVGETDPTVQRFVRQRDAFLRTSEKMVEEYHDKYKRALESDFPDKNDIPWEEIQAAVGSLDNIDPDPDFALIGKRDKAKVAASQKYQSDMAAQYKALDAAEQADITVAIATEPDPDKQKKLISKIRKETRDKKKIAKEALKLNREAAAEAADNTYQQDIDTSFNAKKADAIVLRNQAFSSLREKAPSLFPILLDLRRLTDDLSKQAKRAFGKYSKKDISVKFDNNMGLYVTRRYRMFYEADYVDRILSSTRQADVEIREAAIEFMRDHYIRVETDSLMKNSAQLSLADAQKAAEDSYNKKSRGQRSLGHQMIAEFLNSYDTEQGAADFKSAFDFTDKTQTRSDKFSSRELKALTKNLEGRANIPKPLADLMGANNIPEESVDALLYTMGTVAKIGSHQTFLNSMRRYGTQGENPWLLTSAQRKQKRDDAKTDEEFQKFSAMEPIVPQGSDSPLNPLAGLYVDKEILEGLLPLFQQTVRAPEDASSQLMATLLRGAQKATGSAMALKTLGSIGFYLRNALSNVLFFGPAQGRVFSSVAALAKGDPLKGTGLSFGSAAMRAFKGTKAETSAYLRSLEALGVFGDEVRSEVMIKLMRGEESFANLQDQLEDLNNRALKSKSKKVLSEAGAMAARLGSAMDSFYKVSYFESEMATIEEAMKAEKSMPESKRTFTNMTELQRKQYAADIISATAQSYARALPVIKKFTGSSLGLVVAPFVRFTAEVPRIAVNTFTLALREMKNDNRVIKRRGQKRLAGFTSVMAFSTAIPALIAKLVSDIGEEEDEAYRMSLPPYLRNHTFYYFRTSDAPLGKFAGLVGKLAGGMKTTDGDFVTLDLTYLNPFAVIADPILRATEHIVRGEPVEAIEKAITTAFLEPYLGDQILAGSIMDVRENRDARTNKPIFEETDAVHTKLAKQLLYVGKEAYGPRTALKAIEAVQAAGGVTEKFGDSPFGILMSEFYPVRFRQVNSTDQFRNVIFRMKSEQQRVNSRFNSLLNKGAMGEGETQRVYEDVLRSRTRINLKLRQALRGFNGFGASAKDLYGELRRAKYGDRRTKLLFTDFMENPVPSRELVNKLLQSEQGRQRLQWIMDIQQENPRFLRLDD